ncbi:MAG: hypothetical protein AAGD09_27660 [Cyanobacteria bacterium P01_F01_bin.56]
MLNPLLRESEGLENGVGNRELQAHDGSYQEFCIILALGRTGLVLSGRKEAVEVLLSLLSAIAAGVSDKLRFPEFALLTWKLNSQRMASSINQNPQLVGNHMRGHIPSM